MQRPVFTAATPSEAMWKGSVASTQLVPSTFEDVSQSTMFLALKKSAHSLQECFLLGQMKVTTGFIGGIYKCTWVVFALSGPETLNGDCSQM